MASPSGTALKIATTVSQCRIFAGNRYWVEAVTNYACYDAAWEMSGGDNADRILHEWPSPTAGGGI